MKHIDLVFPEQFQNRIVNFGSLYAGNWPGVLILFITFHFEISFLEGSKKSDLLFWYLAHLIKQPITKLRFRISFTLFVSLLNFWRYKQFVKVQDWKFQYCLLDTTKVIYPKYSKRWQSTVAHTIDCLCSKILNHGLNHGLFLSSFKLIPCPIHWANFSASV